MPKIEDKLLDSNHWDEMRPISAIRCTIISCPKKNSTHRKIQFLLVSINSKRTNSMRDCIYDRSKAAVTALVEISVRISIVRPNSLNSNGAIMYMLPAAKRVQIPAVSLIRNSKRDQASYEHKFSCNMY